VLDLSYKFCGTYQCLCIDVDPDECYPDADQGGDDRISLVAWLRTPAVVDLVLREKLCSTQQWLIEGCQVVGPARG
jgi:hypothetical protein